MSVASGSERDDSSARFATAIPALAVIASTLVIVGPLLGRGYVLSYDMVFAPRMPIHRDSLGLGSALPRAVPSDLVAALASHVLAGDVVQQLVLGGLLLLAGAGAARLAPVGALPRTASALAYLWTPYFGERLLLGQWAVLVGYAGLPWLVEAAGRARRGTGGTRRYDWARLTLVLGLMCLGGFPAWLLALITAIPVLAWRERGDPPSGAALPTALPGALSRVPSGVLRGLAGMGLLAVFALPWAVPALLRSGGVHTDPAGATLFAPRADTHLTTLGSLLTGGGIWNADTVVTDRASVLGAVGAAVLFAVSVCGLFLTRLLARRGQPAPRELASLAVGAAIGLVVAAITIVPAGARAVGRLPGGALLRDSQRLIAPWVLLTALGFAVAVTALARHVGRDARPAACLVVLLPVVVLPGLGWGVGGALRGVQYPADYAVVRRLIDADPRPGAVLVLPFQGFRSFAWNHDRPVMEPLGHWLDRVVISSGDLPVATGRDAVHIVRGEDGLAAAASTAIANAEDGAHPLAQAVGRLGVRWVVIDGASDAGLVQGMRADHVGPVLSVYEVPGAEVTGPDPADRAFAASAGPVIAGDVLAVTLLAASGLWTIVVLIKMLLTGIERKSTESA